MSISEITTNTLTMSAVFSNGGPAGGDWPTSECNTRQASVKVDERKNTQVMQISKSVRSGIEETRGLFCINGRPHGLYNNGLGNKRRLCGDFRAAILE